MENIRKDKGYVHNMGRADPVLYPHGCSCNVLQKEVILDLGFWGSVFTICLGL